MVPTEVLAIELRQYTPGAEQVLMPRLIGQTAAAADIKRRTSRPRWTVEELRNAYAALDPPGSTVASMSLTI